jgi:cytochrome c2
LYKLKNLAVAALFATLGNMATADSWTLNADASRIAFGSVKKDTVGEVHSFESISGTVGADGAAMIEIDLSSVQTLIDIRNERMVEHVFKNAPKAMLNAQIDMAEVSGLAVGSSTVVDATGNIELAGNALEIDAELFVLRINDAQVMVSTNDMIMLSIADMGLSAGIDKLMELAKLPGITRVSPVTLRLIFDMDEKKAEAAPAAAATTTQVAMAGDADAGKKVFRKCKACHSLKEGKNGAGPSLHGIIGAAAGQTEGFRYSKAMIGSGITWDAETLAGYLADPKGYMPGNKVAFRGLRKDEEIENVIAYLAAEG